MKMTKEKKEQILTPLLGVGVILAALVVFIIALYGLAIIIRLLFFLA